MKKAGEIKSTLELSITTKSQKITSLSQKDLTDWLLVSEVADGDIGDKEFVVADERFFVSKSTKHKCPRCWKFASIEEEKLCARCEEVLS